MEPPSSWLLAGLLLLSSNGNSQYKLTFQPSSPCLTLWCELEWLDNDVHWASRRNLPSTSRGLKKSFCATPTTRIGSTFQFTNSTSFQAIIRSQSFPPLPTIYSLAEDQCLCSRKTLLSYTPST